MVSKNPNPAEGFYLDASGTVLPGMGQFGAAEDLSLKIRKPYTITKSRESWTEPEHDKFLEALQLFDRDWKKIEAFIGSKTVIQIRSHAQKYFLKVQRSGTNEHLPPPRPKRKASHPYPQKASKNVLPQVVGALQSSGLLEPGYVLSPDSPSIPRDPIAIAAVSTCPNNSVQTASISNVSKGPEVATNGCSSTESTPKTWPIEETKDVPRIRPIEKTKDQGNHGNPLRVLPDFVQVYTFIGSVFDPSVTGHLQKLKMMDPIDVETVLLLMRNLSMNLNSPDFEDHRKLLSSYEIDRVASNRNAA